MQKNDHKQIVFAEGTFPSEEKNKIKQSQSPPCLT